MRIIAGSAKGSQIFSPKGQQTRPTQDRVRESLFNILQRDIPNAHVLDLFAGSGALALEALSRGAEDAVLVDRSYEAIQCIHRNIKKLNFGMNTQVMQCDWKIAVQKLSQQKCTFSLVFLDPPYCRTDIVIILDTMLSARILTDGALVVVEHQKGEALSLTTPFELRDSRIYRDTEISFFDIRCEGIVAKEDIFDR